MKLISISTDKKVFDTNSGVRERITEYGKIFDELHLIVLTLGAQDQNLKIGHNVFIYPTNSKNRFFYLIDAFRIGRKLIKSPNLKTETVLSVQDPFETGLIGLLLKIIYKLPLQVQVHTDFTNKYFLTHSFLNFVRTPLGIVVLSFADSVRCVSERIVKSIHSLSNNISILPVYTNMRQAVDSKERSKDKTNPIRFLTISRLEKEKDLETAIKAFKKVVLSGIAAEFMIVGDGSQRSSLELLAKNLGLGDKTHFVGWQKNTENYYREADVYLSTSLYEGYGMSVIEAASFGLPCVLSDAGVAGYILKDKKEAFVCKQKEVSNFAKAMIELCFSQELRERMGESARNAVSKQYSMEQYLDLYKDSVHDALHFYYSGQGIFKKNILARYLVAGITGAGTQIGLLYILTDVLGFWYLYSSIISFVIAIVISFILQKLWTFGDKKVRTAHHQFGKYLVVAVCGICINTAFMYILVDIVHIWYILAQIITGAVIAIFNFLMYKFFVFKQ